MCELMSLTKSVSKVHVYGFLYGVQNFNFIEILISGICVFHTDSALSAVILLYYIVVIMFTVLLVLVIVIYTFAGRLEE